MNEVKKHNLLIIISIILTVSVFVAIINGFRILSSLPQGGTYINREPWVSLCDSTYIIGIFGLIAIILGIKICLVRQEEKWGIFIVVLGFVSLILDILLMFFIFAKGS